MSQNALTVILNVKPGEGDALQAYLREIGDNIENNPHLPFYKFQTLHFARFIMLENNTRMVFSTVHDGSLYKHLDEFHNHAPQALHAIFSKCVGYPESKGTLFRRDFNLWISRNAYSANTFFKAYPLYTLPEVRNALKLRDALESAVAQPQLEQIFGLLSGVRGFPKPDPVDNLFRDVVKLPLATFSRQFFAAVLKVISPEDPPPAGDSQTGAAPKVIAPHALTERHAIDQNEMTLILKVRKDRIDALKKVLWLLNVGTNVTTNGQLSGITTIHFARWALYDDGNMMYFESNYDGTWENYIGDFVDRAWWGLDAMGRCCIGYPWQGARNIQAFQNAVVAHQVRADLFYSAYPQHSVRNILNSLRMYEAIRRVLDSADVSAILKRL